jgi:dienelactone hydrolase
MRVKYLARLTVLGPFCAAAMMPAATISSAQVARTELHQIRTVTLSDHQFLTGSKSGTPVVIAGALRIPRPGTDRLPAVILLHGSGGIGGNVDRWSQELNGIGIATFIVDSFTGRGLQTVSADQARLGRLNMIIDAFRALELVAAHARVDPARIALMGFSRGGQSVLYASLKRFQRMHGPEGLEFAAYVPFYPSCAATFIDDENVSPKPIRIHHGSADDYVPVAPCREYVERLRKAGNDVQLTEYAEAHHTFDNPLLKEGPQPVSRSQTVRGCKMHEEPAGLIINSVTKQPFSYEDPCVERGPNVGYNAAAHAAAIQAVKQFLRLALKID